MPQTPAAQQARRAYEAIARKGDPLEQYIGLAALHDRNENLFYRALIDHIEELLRRCGAPVTRSRRWTKPQGTAAEMRWSCEC